MRTVGLDQPIGEAVCELALLNGWMRVCALNLDYVTHVMQVYYGIEESCPSRNITLSGPFTIPSRRTEDGRFESLKSIKQNCRGKLLQRNSELKMKLWNADPARSETFAACGV